MKTFKLHLIRHGMTAGNLQGLYIGSGTDIPLCDEGRAQLKELKERFEYPQVDTVFSSPLVRAVETARPMCAAWTPTSELLCETPVILCPGPCNFR